MESLERLLLEIDRRSLWQAVRMDRGAGWAAIRARHMIPLVATVAVVCLRAALIPDALAGQMPRLFETDELLEVTLRSDFRALVGDRGDERPTRPARLIIDGGDGHAALDMPVGLRTRGNLRRERSVCRFPPIRVEFDGDSTAGTLFEGQRRLKLVTHCRNNDAYERDVVEEFLVYRIFNLVTPASFQVRPMRVTYEDTNGRQDSETRFGFFIESDDAMAARVGGEAVEDDDEDHPRMMRSEALALMSVFQYLIGNTDWSVTALHNIVAVVPADGVATPVPYDFDSSGLVDAPYAAPPENIGTRSVRVRVFRGFCEPPVDYPSVYARLVAVRQSVDSLVRTTPLLDQGAANSLMEYLDEGWGTLENPDRAYREIERQCRESKRGARP